MYPMRHFFKNKSYKEMFEFRTGGLFLVSGTGTKLVSTKLQAHKSTIRRQINKCRLLRWEKQESSYLKPRYDCYASLGGTREATPPHQLQSANWQSPLFNDHIIELSPIEGQFIFCQIFLTLTYDLEWSALWKSRKQNIFRNIFVLLFLGHNISYDGSGHFQRLVLRST